MKNLFVSIFVITFFMITQAFALDLHGARKDGLVGEKPDGYVAAIQSSKEVDALVAEVNAKRAAEYARISKENGQAVGVVAKLAAQQIINGLASGEKYQDASGAWKVK